MTPQELHHLARRKIIQLQAAQSEILRDTSVHWMDQREANIRLWTLSDALMALDVAWMELEAIDRNDR